MVDEYARVMEPPWSLVLAALSLLVTVFLSARSWYYGGAVVTVELDLMERRWMGADLTGSIARWKTGTGLHATPRHGLRLDIVRLTVRNKGRTAATIMEPGLRVGRQPVPTGSWTIMPPRRLSDGETDPVVRIESHDAKVFYFYLAPMVSGARDEFGDIALAARGAITTGTGETRLSRRWRRSSSGWTWNVLTLPKGVDWIGSDPPTLADRLWLWSEVTSLVYQPPITIAPQFVQVAAKRAESGEDVESISTALSALQTAFPEGDAFRAREGWLTALAKEAINLASNEDGPSSQVACQAAVEDRI
ncbi:hypothetical protein [Microbacterium sp. cx-59]|uniref:hypothetical protein n=1 Tax=Microbacterium sp. cx-59 TaxID=2891207 RepID=UPI001E5CF448|nr:hypothetical protein [Microbacterium sp. cx-59]MCC4907752.1 hypothetical protein [Microbacterium sp. cx-59]